jgi:hypothetical protein
VHKNVLIPTQVICTLLAKDGTWLPSQLNLLDASLRVGATRFAPAEFGCGPQASLRVGLLAAQTPIWDACRKARAEHPGFEWAGFHLGLFMNYLGNGCAGEKEALAGKSDDGEFIFYMKDLKAAIPLREDGGIPRISMMEIGDVGRFVAAACSLPAGAWREDFSMVGETLRMDEVVKIIERVRGKKVEVVSRTTEEIRREKEENKEDEMKFFWLELEETYASDKVGEGVIEPVLNGLCPDVKSMSVEEYVTKFWTGQ